MEHVSNQFTPRPKKYRQVEETAKNFLNRFGTDLSVRPVCIFYTPLENGGMLLRIGNAIAKRFQI